MLQIKARLLLMLCCLKCSNLSHGRYVASTWCYLELAGVAVSRRALPLSQVYGADRASGGAVLIPWVSWIIFVNMSRCLEKRGNNNNPWPQPVALHAKNAKSKKKIAGRARVKSQISCQVSTHFTHFYDRQWPNAHASSEAVNTNSTKYYLYCSSD